jgi:hypothetical protein
MIPNSNTMLPASNAMLPGGRSQNMSADGTLIGAGSGFNKRRDGAGKGSGAARQRGPAPARAWPRCSPSQKTCGHLEQPSGAPGRPGWPTSARLASLPGRLTFGPSIATQSRYAAFGSGFVAANYRSDAQPFFLFSRRTDPASCGTNTHSVPGALADEVIE